MGEKKKPGRFTLQFNLEDPQQRTASELLEQQGRRKAQFITSAVLHYVQQKRNEELSAIDETALERMLLSILEKRPQITEAVSRGPSNAPDPPAQVTTALESWETSMGDDALKAITDTLAAFKQ